MVVAAGPAESDGGWLHGEALACVRGERLVFESVGFSVGPGEALILEGPNGAGKTSLLRLIAGLLKPEAGRLTWRGHAIAEEPERFLADLHFAGHQDAIKPLFTAVENLGFWARFRGYGDEHVAPALEAFGLTPLADVPARFLSAGQKRRLGLARILAAPAPLWLLDEPTVSLDTASIAGLERVIADHRAAGGLVIAATHAPLMGADTNRLAMVAAS